jgi:hypothetical protein
MIIYATNLKIINKAKEYDSDKDKKGSQAKIQEHNSLTAR